MKNEAMARAITNIDDELIVDAQREGVRGKSPAAHLSRWCAAAACLAAVLTAAVMLRAGIGGAEVYMHGEALGTQPVPVADGVAPQMARDVHDGEDETVEAVFTSDAGSKTVYSVQDGQLQLFENDVLIDEGSSCTGSGEVSLIWRIENADTNISYTLNAGGTKLILSYDSTMQCWVICKE